MSVAVEDQIDFSDKGFSLIELSIVIVIIGLIVASVVGGAAIVRASKFRVLISDINKIEVAVNTFTLEYKALPGDMRNAKDYWSSCTDDGSNQCNGDGDGKIEYYQLPGPRYEAWRAHQLLLLSSLWQQSLTSPGVRGAVSCDLHQSCIGQNVPEGVFEGLGYTINGISSSWGIDIGALDTNVGGYSTAANFFTNTEVELVDKKIDDALPRSGLITSKDWPSGTCGVQTIYELNNPAKICSIRYR